MTLPGVPGIVIGSTRRVAWGFTALNGDLLDLVRLKVNSENPGEYQTPSGWKPFDIVNEKIQVKGGEEIIYPIKLTIWGAVSERQLMGKPVAIHWMALDPTAVDIALLDIDTAVTLEDAMKVFNRWSGPPLNVVMADETGRVGWTLCGKIPIRKGFDGATSRSWADGQIGWEGYIPPDELPRVVDPPSGFLATANNRTLGKGYPYLIGHNYINGYRAYRISERLSEMKQITEQDLLTLQLDTKSGFYDFYAELALSVLTDDALATHPPLKEVRKYIETWRKDEKADVDSLGFGILVRFREVLAQDVLAPFLAACQARDENFAYTWHNPEPPLREMLSKRIPEVLPEKESYPNWESFIVSKLQKSIQELLGEYDLKRLDKLTWGRINTAEISHPLAQAIPVLGRFLNMPKDPLAGSAFCIRVIRHPAWGASERMVISPGKPEDGILQMPGGQSGHPLSAHYRDGHRSWVVGTAVPFLPGLPLHTLKLKPKTG